ASQMAWSMTSRAWGLSSEASSRGSGLRSTPTRMFLKHCMAGTPPGGESGRAGRASGEALHLKYTHPRGRTEVRTGGRLRSGDRSPPGGNSSFGKEFPPATIPRKSPRRGSPLACDQSGSARLAGRDAGEVPDDGGGVAAAGDEVAAVGGEG